METKKGCLSVSEIAEQLRSEIRKCLPFAHAISECDTVSSTYGPGKLRAYKKLNELNSWRDIKHIVGDDGVDREYMIEMREIFYMELYCKLGKRQICLITIGLTVFQTKLMIVFKRRKNLQEITGGHAVKQGKCFEKNLREYASAFHWNKLWNIKNLCIYVIEKDKT